MSRQRGRKSPSRRSARRRCKCRCGYSCFVDGRRTCGLSPLECAKEHFYHECGHQWDGEWWESEDGRASSVTCSRCGMTRMHHDMMVGP